MVAFILRFFIFTGLTVAINADGGLGCVDPENPLSPEPPVKIGERHTICLTLGDSIDWGDGVEYIRYTFRPIADQYSKFHVPQSYSQLVPSKNSEKVFSTSDVGVSVAAQTRFSYLSRYLKRSTDGTGTVYPFLTAIIDVKDGEVQGVAWDDACVFCAKEKCSENIYDYNGKPGSEIGIVPNESCSFSEEECNDIDAKGETTCDITLFVVWTGTDADGAPFQSSGYRFSAFPPASLKDRLMNLIPELPDWGWSRR